MRHALNLVEDVPAAALDRGNKIPEGLQVAPLVVCRQRRRAAHEHQPGMSGEAVLNVAVDALRLHDRAGDAATVHLLRGLLLLRRGRAHREKDGRKKEQAACSQPGRPFACSHAVNHGAPLSICVDQTRLRRIGRNGRVRGHSRHYSLSCNVSAPGVRAGRAGRDSGPAGERGRATCVGGGDHRSLSCQPARFLANQGLRACCAAGPAAPPKAQRGHSTEKRTDSPLLTLGLVLDASGFVRHSEVFAGAVNEDTTLEPMLEALQAPSDALVALDAGVATEANVAWLREGGYRYLVVSRERTRRFDPGPGRRPQDPLAKERPCPQGHARRAKSARHLSGTVCRPRSRKRQEDGRLTPQQRHKKTGM